MKKQEVSFMGPDLFAKREEAIVNNNVHLAFNWDEAARIIKDEFEKHPDLMAEAGLQGDWDYTGGIIFQNGKPTNDSYTYLSSNWAEPTLILSWDNQEQLEIQCWIRNDESRFSSDSKWDGGSLAILGIEI